MQKSSMWKLAALAAVSALGFFAVVQTQRGLQDESPTEDGSATVGDGRNDRVEPRKTPLSERQVRLAQREPKTAPLNDPFDEDDSRREPSAAKAGKTAVASFPQNNANTSGFERGTGPRFDLGGGDGGSDSAATPKTASNTGTDAAPAKKVDNPFAGGEIEDGFKSKSAKSPGTDSPPPRGAANPATAPTTATKSDPPKSIFGDTVEPRPPAAKNGDDSPRNVFGSKFEDPNMVKTSGGVPAPKSADGDRGPSNPSDPFGTLPDERKATGKPADSNGPSLSPPAAHPPKTATGSGTPVAKSAAKTTQTGSKQDADKPQQPGPKSSAGDNPFAAPLGKPESVRPKQTTPKPAATTENPFDAPPKPEPKAASHNVGPLDARGPTQPSGVGPAPGTGGVPSSTPNDADLRRKRESGSGTPFPEGGKKHDQPLLNVAPPAAPSKSPMGSGSPPRLMPVPPVSRASQPSAAPKSASTKTHSPAAAVASGNAAGPTPQVTIHKTAPASAVLGKAFVYDILIRNVGGRTAHNVVVQDPIPSGVRLEGTDPQAYLSRNNLVWKLGSLAAGASRKISVKVTPVRAGQIGSVATVNFLAEAAVPPEQTQPKLTFHMQGPPQAKLGEKVAFRFSVSNVGRTAANDVWLRDILPDGLKHPAGDDLEYKIGSLPAGKTETISLSMTVAKAGRLTNRAIITAAGGVRIEAKSVVNVAAPKLVISRTGPSRQMIGRPAVYQNMVTNGSTEAVQNATLVEAVPAGMDFVTASHGGKFDAVRRSVTWSLGPLGPGQSQTAQLQLLPKQAGVQSSVIQATGTDGSVVQTASATKVVGYAALGIDVPPLERPVSIGEQVTLRVIGRNRGTAASSKVKISVTLPAQLSLVSVRGRGRYSVSGGTIAFDTIESLAGKDRAVYDLTVKAVAQGDSRVKVQIQSDEMSRPLRREEAVLVLPASP